MPAVESRSPRTRRVAGLLAVSLGAGAAGLLSALPAQAAADPSAEPLFVETSAQDRDTGDAFNTRVEIADMNQDGSLDMVSAAGGSGNGFYVELGNGDGTFQAAVKVPAGGTGTSVTVGDVTGDSYPDVVAKRFVNGVDGSMGVGLAVYVGSASGTSFVLGFQGGFHLVTALGDLDLDGDLDLLASAPFANQVYENDGVGGFTLVPTNIPQGAMYDMPAPVDFNGDGRGDFAMPDSFTDMIHVVLSDPESAAPFVYLPAQDYPTMTTDVYGVVTGDADDDGDQDFAYTAAGGTGQVRLARNNGLGSFTETVLASGNVLGSPVFADFNGDGASDAAYPLAGSVRLLLGDGAGGYVLASRTYGAVGEPFSLSVGDFNGDNRTDVVAPEYFEQVNHVLTNLGNAGAPAVTSQPAAQAVTAGEPFSFTAAASGAPAPTVQWERSTDAGASYSLLSDASAFSTTYTGTATSDMDGHLYRAVFTNGVAPDARSDSAVLTVNSAPAITMHPSDQSVSDLSEVTFSARSDDPTATVGWLISYDDGATFFGVAEANSQDYTWTAQLNEDGEQLYAVFSNEFGSTATNIATMTVNANAPTVIEDPQSQTVDSGMAAVFQAQASSNPVATVQWQVSTDDGETYDDLIGETGTGAAFLVDYSHNGNLYRAVFTNPGGDATTESAVLTVTPIEPQVTDHPDWVTVQAGVSVTFAADAAGDPAPTVQWQVSTDGGNTFADVDGATDPSYTFTATAADTGSLHQAVFTNAGGTGTSSPALLTVNVAPVVTAEPEAQTVVEGEAASFTAEATGQPEPLVQWQVSADGVTYEDVVGAYLSTYEFSTELSDDGNHYRAVFANDGGTAISNSATLAVSALPVLETPSAPLDVTATQSGPGEITVGWEAPADEGSSPVTSYEVDHQTQQSLSAPSRPGNVSAMAPAIQYSKVLSGLEDGDYLLSVTAVNGVGAGVPAFVEVTVATATPPTDPPVVDGEDPVVDDEDTVKKTVRYKVLPVTGTEIAALATTIVALLFVGSLILFAGWRSRPKK